MRPQQLVIVSARDQASSTRSFNLRPLGTTANHAITFIPGQVAILKANNEQGYFAFAGAPDDPELEVRLQNYL